jgi:thiol-disulfide isomerase/thioredoxin
VQTNRTLWLALLYTAPALAFLALSTLGVFRGVERLPLTAGLAWGGLGAVAYFAGGRRFSRGSRALLVAGVAMALAAAPGQRLGVRIESGRMESSALETLAGRPAPPFPHIEILNGPLDTSPREDGLVVVNFWATWCRPCVQELPILQDFADRHAGDPVELLGFTKIYGLNDEESRKRKVAEIREFLGESGVRYPVLVAEDYEAHKSYLVSVIPTTILIDGGEVVDYGIGIEGTRSVLQETEKRLRERVVARRGGG